MIPRPSWRHLPAILWGRARFLAEAIGWCICLPLALLLSVTWPVWLLMLVAWCAYCAVAGRAHG